MEVLEAIEQRRSCRSFRPDPLPREQLETLLAHAAEAPSAVNLQPWHVWVAGGEELERLKSALVRAYRERRVGCSPGGGNAPPPAQDRGPGSFRELGQIVAARGEDFGEFINEGSCRLYGAPIGVFCFLAPGEPSARLVDCGLWLAHLLLAAQDRGLATCPVGLLVAYADVVREALFVPDGYQLACAVALGHAREADPVNEFVSPRKGVETVQWVF
jgi:nitroreductase